VLENLVKWLRRNITSKDLGLNNDASQNETSKSPEVCGAKAQSAKIVQPEIGAVDQQTLETKIRFLTEENQRLRDDVSMFFGQLHRERLRLDYVLSELEGIGRLRNLLIEQRDTVEFQSAFDEPSPLVSVLIATCDRPILLVERCLNSIINQTYTNLQIIVVGDHSIDETQNLVAALRDDRIEFYNLKQRGPYPRPGLDRWYVAGTAPLIAAQPMAKGHFITYLDDDDSWDLRRVEIMVNVAKEHRAELIWHKFWRRNKEGNWELRGNGKMEHGQVGVQMVFYHRFFLQVPWDIYSYRIPEPNDWNHLRKIWHLRPKAVFVDQPLTWFFKNFDSAPFQAQKDEVFVD
jgi:hypothetical protein